MLGTAWVSPTIPVTDIATARKFYTDTLGLKEKPEWSDEDDVTFMAGEKSYLSVYKRGPSTADHTLAEFWVEDLDVEMDELKTKGVTFEEYDLPEMNLKTVNGVATYGKIRVAWFKDPFGNIFALSAKTQG